jgi:hypothetical protein
VHAQNPGAKGVLGRIADALSGQASSPWTLKSLSADFHLNVSTNSYDRMCV